jgi:hypothetical protein
MRRVVKEYRYEVGETRMSEECVQYLDQLIIDWKRRQEDQLRQAREEARDVQRRKKRAKKHESHHQRSGTARQEDYTPETSGSSRSRSLGEENDVSDGEDEADDDMQLSSEAEGQVGDASVNSTGTAKVARYEVEALTVAEAVARSAQEMIDGLFTPGKSMSDYVPPWTAAGPPMGLHDDVGGGSVPPSPAKGEGLLNSREMLPFALPSRRGALIVTPGDAFGFGRGHFTGTGTPSVRSVNGDVSSGNSSAASSRRSSISAPVAGEDVEMDSDTSSRTDASGVSRTSSLFPQGKGFAAGGYWSPVPLLPDGMLDRIDAMLTAAAALAPAADKETNILLAQHASDEHLPVGADVGLPRASRIVIPPRDGSMSQPQVDEFGRLTVGMEEEDVKTPGPQRRDALKASMFG